MIPTFHTDHIERKSRALTVPCRPPRCWRQVLSAQCRRVWEWWKAGRSRISRKRSRLERRTRKIWLNRDPEIECYLPGVPRATYLPYPFQILQSVSAMTFVYEYAGVVRNIYLNDPGPAPADSWMGKSVGTFPIEI
jgi:hypothetical protein